MTNDTHLAPERIDAFLDGEMPLEERAAIQQHLVACSTCKAALEQRRELFGLIGGLPEMPAPGDAAPAIVEALQRRQARTRAVEWLLVPQIVVAAALLLFALPSLAERAAGLSYPGVVSGVEILGDPANLFASPWSMAIERASSLPNVDEFLGFGASGMDVSATALQWGQGLLAVPDFETLPPWTWWGIVIAASLFWLIGNGILLQSSSPRIPTES